MTGHGFLPESLLLDGSLTSRRTISANANFVLLLCGTKSRGMASADPPALRSRSACAGFWPICVLNRLASASANIVAGVSRRSISALVRERFIPRWLSETIWCSA